MTSISQHDKQLHALIYEAWAIGKDNDLLLSAIFNKIKCLFPQQGVCRDCERIEDYQHVVGNSCELIGHISKPINNWGCSLFIEKYNEMD